MSNVKLQPLCLLRADEINGYITWFKKEQLPSDYQNTLRHIFESQSNK